MILGWIDGSYSTTTIQDSYLLAIISWLVLMSFVMVVEAVVDVQAPSPQRYNNTSS